MLIGDFHIHSSQDPSDKFITNTPHQIIDRLAKKGVTLASFSHHFKLVWDESWRTYAKSKGVTLIPAVELRINGGDVVLVNAKTDNIHSFEELYNYKINNPDCLIIAAHPFAPILSSLREQLFTNAKLFDAIELSASAPLSSLANLRAKKAANLLGVPMIAGSDSHMLYQIGTAKNAIPDVNTWNEACLALKQGKHTAKATLNMIQKYGVVYPGGLKDKFVLSIKK